MTCDILNERPTSAMVVKAAETLAHAVSGVGDDPRPALAAKIREIETELGRLQPYEVEDKTFLERHLAILRTTARLLRSDGWDDAIPF